MMSSFATDPGLRLRISAGDAAPGMGVPLRIGPVRLETNLLLAPIANYCDLAFRIVCREQGGVGLACTDLLSPHGLLRGTQHSLDLARTHDLDRPVGMQLYGSDGDVLADGARWAVDHGASVVDINMGCPVDKVTKKDGGSRMLCDLSRTVAIASRIVDAVRAHSGGTVPVTAKMRLGWDESCRVAPDLARRLEEVGIAMVTVHGRTAAQKFSGSANWDAIGEVVSAVRTIPVVGNGDVKSPEDALALLRCAGCAGVMIGRGALSAPWLFRAAWDAQQRAASGRDETAGFREPTEAEKIAIIRRYFGLMLEFRGEHYALTHIRRRISWFIKTLGPSRPLQEAVRTAPDAASVHAALDAFLAGGLRRFETAGAPEPAHEPAEAGAVA